MLLIIKYLLDRFKHLVGKMMRRSRSADLSNISREKYLSRWSRENTPSDCVDRYSSNVRRSFTPVRDISAYEVFFCPEFRIMKI